MTGRSDGKARGGIQDALSARFPFRGDIYRKTVWIKADRPFPDRETAKPCAA
jgi:hypothetical protein